MNINSDGTCKGAMGGTELMALGLEKYVDKTLLEQVNIIKSRVREVSPTKPNILWLHDLPEDPESKHLSDPKSVERFDAFVFVSSYQKYRYLRTYDLPLDKCVVLKNAIEPIPLSDRDTDKINFIYHTTPHRGLYIAVAAFDRLAEKYGNRVHFDVYSSFNAYGWPERDKPYEGLFDYIHNHPNMTYHGYQPNQTVRTALQKAHVFLYPSIWEETSCIATIEAMSAGCAVACSDYGALPETTGGWPVMFGYFGQTTMAVDMCYAAALSLVEMYIAKIIRLPNTSQKEWCDINYDWRYRKEQWNQFLTQIIKAHQK